MMMFRMNPVIRERSVPRAINSEERIKELDIVRTLLLARTLDASNALDDRSEEKDQAGSGGDPGGDRTYNGQTDGKSDLVP